MSIINNALSGSLAAQAAINTTSQNVANLQTKGYTRQGVLLSAVAPAAGTGGAGFGVEVSKLIRFPRPDISTLPSSRRPAPLLN